MSRGWLAPLIGVATALIMLAAAYALFGGATMHSAFVTDSDTVDRCSRASLTLVA
jgi:hypothetical protein